MTPGLKASSGGSIVLERDNVYYLEPVIFQVEDRLFKVPRYNFERKSDIFEAMFSLPQIVGRDPEGSNESAPVKLEGVSKLDFQKLLEVMYPLELTATPWLTMSKEEWISVLKLATMWNFKEIRALAISNLSKQTIDPIEQILLAKSYNVPQWLHSGYDAIAQRSRMLSLDEAEQLGYPTAIRVFQVREQARVDGWVNTYDHRYGHDGVPPVGETSRIIENVFENELRVAKAVYDTYLPDRPSIQANGYATL